ncbi:diacylglycerol kinase family protein [Bacillus sp. V59.32b]|uniref:diacylglycerol kinase family protein n=1 Tax=Bacillus sp. V59.32b TaxID=1758642 RepID=UPI000E3E2444|nr:diacylglycerol kinase family protein [Bacillus sp. V59.32b]RFU61329.1 diacylglycerol kinase family protein [Bacillus sp. V59.32b]
MGSQGKYKKRHPLYKSFVYAFQGIWGVVKSERNLKIHLSVAVVVIGAGWYFSVSRLEWLFLLSAIFGTITLEMINSAIERTVDLITGDIHPLAKQAKDIAAGSVLMYAIFAVMVGLIIFLPKLF